VNVADVAASAAEVLDRDGWCKNTVGAEPGMAHCLGGALNIAAWGSTTWHAREEDGVTLYQAVAEVIGEQWPELGARMKLGYPGGQRPGDWWGGWIIAWNDGPATREDVDMVLGKLAAKGSRL